MESWSNGKASRKKRDLRHCSSTLIPQSPLRRIPDRRCIGTVLHDHSHIIRHLYLEKLSIVGGPARLGYLNHAHVVKRALLGIEFRIDPVGRKQRITDRVRVARIRDVYRTADRGLAAAVGANFASVGHRHIIDTLVSFTFFIPLSSPF